MRRRSAALLAAAALVLTATTPLPAAGDSPSSPTPATTACPQGAPDPGFRDVAAGSTHASAIACAVSLGVVRGTSATTFSPSETLTRGQAVSLLARALQHSGITLPERAVSPVFPDGGAAHGDNAARLARAGIVTGFDDGTIRPEEPVTRAQLASLVVRTLAYVRNLDVTAAAPAGFADVAAGSPHAAAIDAAVAEGLLLGRSTERFAPGEGTRRDQAASVIVRLLDLAPADLVGEIWALDQGTDLIHVYEARGEAEVAVIDVSPAALEAAGFTPPSSPITVPHMIEFDSRERYAFIASTAGAVTIVIDAAAKQVVEVLHTGAGTHMATVTPDDSAVWVAAIAAEAMVEIPLDLDVDEPTFAVGRSLDVGELLADVEEAQGWDFPSYQPICHQFSTDATEAWVTLGPGWNQGGAFVLDLATGEATHAWDPEVVRANCGVSITDERAVLNWSGQVLEGDYGDGETYVFDVDTKQLLDTITIEGGFDVHGLRLTPDASAYWQVNRVSNDAVVIDAQSFEIVARYADVAETPDILDFSPDGSLVYISQRGPSPRSGAIHAASGDTPGVAVVDAATGQRLRVIEPDQVREEPSADHPDGRILNDVHGVAVRARGTGERLLDDEVASASVRRTSMTAGEPVTVRPAVEVDATLTMTCSVPRA